MHLHEPRAKRIEFDIHNVRAGKKRLYCSVYSTDRITNTVQY